MRQGAIIQQDPIQAHFQHLPPQERQHVLEELLIEQLLVPGRHAVTGPSDQLNVPHDRQPQQQVLPLQDHIGQFQEDTDPDQEG